MNAGKDTIVILDIETIPNTSLVDMLPEPEANRTLKDPEKIANDIASKKAAQVAGMALSPLWGRVAIVGMLVNDKPVQFVIGDEQDDMSEKKLLVEFFDAVNQVDNYNFVTYNGKAFDVPFMWKRAAFLRVQLEFFKNLVPLSQLVKRYTTAPHCDMMEVLAEGYNQFLKLDVAGRAILGFGKEKPNFADMAEGLKQPDCLEFYLQYNRNDLDMTSELYRICRGVLF